MAEFKFNWVDNPTASGQAICDTDILNDCLMHLKYDKKDGGTGLQMFDTILKDHILTYEESKGLALQGTYVYKEALAGSRYGYPDFYAKCLEEFNQATTTETVNGVTVKVHSNGHKFYDIADKTAIDGFFNTMGTAWFYGVDTTNERIFLPRDNYFAIKGIAPVIGNGMSLGLTDGTNYGGINSASQGGIGDVRFVNQSYNVPLGTTSSWTHNGNNGAIGVTTDPTKSGIEAHLQPKENKYLYICVGNTTNYEGISDVVNQGMEILDQINAGFVPKDSMQEIPCIVETYVNGTSWYRVYSDGWCEQGGMVSVIANNANVVVTFLKPMMNTDYTVTIGHHVASNTDAFYYNQGGVTEKTTQTVTLTNRRLQGNGSYTLNIMWQANGYIA